MPCSPAVRNEPLSARWLLLTVQLICILGLRRSTSSPCLSSYHLSYSFVHQTTMLLTIILSFMLLLFSGIDAVLYRATPFSQTSSQTFSQAPQLQANGPTRLHSSSNSLTRPINNLNQVLHEISFPYKAVPHRNSDWLLQKGPEIARSIAEEISSYGERLPFIVLSQKRFPHYQQVVALPLRFPHGQGGPGTTLAVLQSNKGDEMKVVGFGHVGGIHPDDFASLLEDLERRGRRKITLLGKLYPTLRLSSGDLKLTV